MCATIKYNINIHPLVEELCRDNSKLNEYINLYSKIELRNMIIIGLKKGYKNLVKCCVERIPPNYNFDFDVIVNVAAKRGYLDIIEYLDKEKKINILKLKDLILKKSSFHSNLHILEWMSNKNILTPSEILIYNASIGKSNIIKYFYDKGYDIYFKNNIVIRTAGYNNQFDCVRYLHSNLSCDIRAQNDSILRVCCESGYLDIVKYALDCGADVDSNDSEPIRKSCIYGHTEIVKLLVGRGANLKINNNEPICKACLNGHIDIVKYLISMGVDINANNSEPLKLSIRHSHLDIFNLLIDSGANIITNANILIYESINGKLDKVTDYLIDKKLHLIGDNSKSLVRACELGNIKLVSLLLNNFTDINCYNGIPLVKSIEGCNYELVKFLISNGAKLDPIDNSLVSQTLNKSHRVVKLLIENELDLNILSTKVLKKLADYGFIDNFMIETNENDINKENNNNKEEEIITDFNFDEFTIAID